MTVPIKAVQAGASRLAAGDFDQTIKVRTGDEIEILADEFNRMAGQLREVYARLEQKVEDRTRDLAQSVRELTALEEVGRALAASLALEDVLATILTRAVELAEADGGAIYGFDRDARSFHLAGAHGLDPALVEALRDVEPTRLEGLLGEVAAHGRTGANPRDRGGRGISPAGGDARRRASDRRSSCRWSARTACSARSSSKAARPAAPPRPRSG